MQTTAGLEKMGARYIRPAVEVRAIQREDLAISTLKPPRQFRHVLHRLKDLNCTTSRVVP